MRCVKCDTLNQVGLLVIIDNLHIMRKPYTGFYDICDKCQVEVIKPLKILIDSVRDIKDWDERKEEQDKVRLLCKSCFQPFDRDHWTLIFISHGNWVRHTTYVHPECGKSIEKRLKILEEKNGYIPLNSRSC